MLEIDSDEIKVNDGLTAWQQAVANVKVPVFEEPQDRIYSTDMFSYISYCDQASAGRRRPRRPRFPNSLFPS